MYGILLLELAFHLINKLFVLMVILILMEFVNGLDQARVDLEHFLMEFYVYLIQEILRVLMDSHGILRELNVFHYHQDLHLHLRQQQAYQQPILVTQIFLYLK